MYQPKGKAEEQIGLEAHSRMKITGNFKEVERDVTRALMDYLDHTQKGLTPTLEKQAVALVVGAKGVKGLYQEARSHAEETKSEIRSVARRIGYRIRRAPGVTVKQEIASRLKNAGWYQSTGWLSKGIPISGVMATRLRTVRGYVHIRANRFKPVITVGNISHGALEFGLKTGYIQRALMNRARDMRVYVQRKMASDAKQFSKPVKRPRYQSIDAQLDALMRV